MLLWVTYYVWGYVFLRGYDKVLLKKCYHY